MHPKKKRVWTPSEPKIVGKGSLPSGSGFRPLPAVLKTESNTPGVSTDLVPILQSDIIEMAVVDAPSPAMCIECESSDAGSTASTPSRVLDSRRRIRYHPRQGQALPVRVGQSSFTVAHISSLPIGKPLEKPMHPKKKRVWTPSEPKIVGKESLPSGSGFRPLPAVLKTESNTPGVSTDPVPILESVKIEMAVVDDPSPATSIECGSSNAGSIASTPSRLLASKRRIRHHPRPLTLHYGSEPSTDDSSDEEDIVPQTIPRSLRVEIDTPEDEEQNAPLSDPASALQHEEFLPQGFFDFSWVNFLTPNIPPQERREAFTASCVGPKEPCQDPYHIFTSIWNADIMNSIAHETNVYAQQVATQKMDNNTMHPSSRICHWVDTTADELYVYFGVILAMGVVIKSSIEDYWSRDGDIFCTPGFAALMPLRRFQLINSCLHFVNNNNMRVQELSQSEAKLFKIAPIVQHLNSKFQDLYFLDQNIALDESLLQWKGWLNINQFISHKAASIGIKSYEVCESQTGYLWRFEIHAHQKVTLPPQLQSPIDAATPSLVLRLIEGLENRGHTVWMDNYYNSPALCRKMKTLGFDVVGTLRTNRQFVPHELHNLKKADMLPGQIAGLTSGDVDIMVWRDLNRVATISTYHGNATANVDDKIKPILILDYNVMMGGVDKKDQMLAMYPIERKRTRVWYKKLFRRLLNVSVLNSFIICKKSSSPLTHRSFRKYLVKALLSRHSTVASIPQLPSAGPTVFVAKTHYLELHPTGHAGVRLRRRCCQCKKLTTYYCAGCNKAVCISSCFVSLHS